MIKWLVYTLLKFFNNSRGGEVLDQDLVDLGPGISSANNLIFLSLNFINKMRVILILPTSEGYWIKNEREFENSLSSVLYLLEDYNLWWK